MQTNNNGDKAIEPNMNRETTNETKLNKDKTPEHDGKPEPNGLPALPSERGQEAIRNVPTPDIFLTDEELYQRTGNGKEGTPEHEIYIGIAGIVYNVTKGRLFYGPGGPYSPFAGRDATIGLATFNLARMRRVEGKTYKPLQEKHLRNINHWKKLFSEKYEKVGKCAMDREVADLIDSVDKEKNVEEKKKEKSKLCSIL